VSRTVRYGILHDAIDEAALYELTWRSTSHIGRQTIEHHPERTIDEVRPELVELLRQGFVEMYETTDPESALDLERALSVAADDASWAPARPPPSPLS
jgi:hypothetical protein